MLKMIGCAVCICTLWYKAVTLHIALGVVKKGMLHPKSVLQRVFYFYINDNSSNSTCFIQGLDISVPRIDELPSYKQLTENTTALKLLTFMNSMRQKYQCFCISAFKIMLKAPRYHKKWTIVALKNLERINGKPTFISLAV